MNTQATGNDTFALAQQAGFDIIDDQICAPDIDGGCTEEVERLVNLLRPTTPAVPSVQPVDRYMSLYAEAEDLLTRIHEAHDDHYGYNPDDITWGHVGTLGHFVEILQYAMHAIPGQKT